MNSPSTMHHSPITANALPNKTRTESMLLNVGPSHPAMHGIVRLILELDGEKVLHSEVEIGYLHRAFEKSAEQSGYLQVMPYTDRLNYVSPLINNTGYCLAVEKLFGLEITERAKYIRVILCELSRVADHLTCVGASAMELGAFTAFLYMMKARENIYFLIDEITGGRVTVSYMRIGGVKADLVAGFEEKCRMVILEARKVLKECHGLLTCNRIFVDRMKEIGILSKENAITYGITGPFLRSTGIDYDVRRATPYLVYDRFDFEIPVGEHGDNYDRYQCRMEEMEQSMRIVEQALKQIPKGSVLVDVEGKEMVTVQASSPTCHSGLDSRRLPDPESTAPNSGSRVALRLPGMTIREGNLERLQEITGAEMVDEAKMGRTEGLASQSVAADPTLEGNHKADQSRLQADNKHAVLPAKENTYGNIEGLMQHFKLIMEGHGIRPPKGEAYFPVEGANGELGFYVVSDGTGQPYRVRVRPPCFPIMAALPTMLDGGMLADVVATFGSVNMIGGELDR